MKNIQRNFLKLASSLSILIYSWSIMSLAATKEIELDALKTVVFTESGNEAITKSDTERPDISGTVKPLDDQIFEILIFKDAQKMRISPDDQEIDRYFNTIARENNLRSEDFEKIAASAGLTLPELKQKLKRVQAINQMLDFKIRQNLIVSKKEIEAYFNAHPENEEAQYVVSFVLVPFGNRSKDELKKKLTQYSLTGSGMALAWTAPFTLKKSEIADEKSYITRLSKGKISRPRETGQGFELFKMIEIKPERLIPLEERSREIADMLRTPKFNELLDSYRKTLFNNATILEFQ